MISRYSLGGRRYSLTLPSGDCTTSLKKCSLPPMPLAMRTLFFQPGPYAEVIGADACVSNPPPTTSTASLWRLRSPSHDLLAEAPLADRWRPWQDSRQRPGHLK